VAGGDGQACHGEKTYGQGIDFNGFAHDSPWLASLASGARASLSGVAGFPATPQLVRKDAACPLRIRRRLASICCHKRSCKGSRITLHTGSSTAATPPKASEPVTA